MSTLSIAPPPVTPWTAVTFAGTWANFGGAYNVMQYRKVGDVVELRGLIASGTLSTPAFTLPVGFRPPADLIFPVVASAGLSQVEVTSAGVCTPQTGGVSTFYSLSNIRFSTVA